MMPELIDKQAALKNMCEMCGYCERFENAMRSMHPDFVTDKCNNYKFLAEQPTIDAEPVRHGKWLVNSQYAINVCSVCGYGKAFGADNYCPNCGAKLDL